jgi:hypothetical protein
MAVFVASQLAIIALGGVTYLMTASDPSAIATKARTA